MHGPYPKPYIVYRKSGAPSITRLPRSACLLQYRNHTLRAGTITRIKRLHLSQNQQGLQNQTAGNEENSRDSRPRPRPILRRILRPKRHTTHDPSNSPKPNKRGTRQSTSPLSTDIVCLVRHGCWDIGIRPGHGEKYACVAGRISRGEAHHG